MAYQTIVADSDEGICVIRLNRPDVMNALNAQMLRELAEAMRAAFSSTTDRQVRHLTACSSTGPPSWF